MADYGAQDTSTTNLGANQFPISEVWTPNAGFSAVEGGTQTTDAGGKKSAPVRIEVKDGNDVAQGLTTDAAVTGDNPGTLSAKLRGLSKIWADVWDSVNHRLHVNVDAGSITANAGTNLNTSTLALESGGHLANIDTHTPAQGQATKANSSPVVLASDQGDVLIKGDFTEQASLTTTGTAPTNLLGSTDVSAYKWWSLHVTGMATGGTLTFKCSNDGTNFINLIAFRLDNPSSGLVSSTTNASGTIWGGPVTFRYLEVVETAWTSGNTTGVLELYTVPPAWAMTVISAIQSGTWTVQPGNTANTTPWLASDHDGTNKANNLAATSVSNALSNQSARLMAGAVQEVSFTTTTVQAVASTDVSNYRWISVMVGAQGTSSTVTFQTSNDNSNWFSCILFGSSAAPSSGASSTTTTGMWHGPLPGRYFRLNVTGISAGTTSGVIELYTVPATPHTIGASALQNGTWTMQPGNTQNTTPWMVTAAGLPTGLASYVIKEVKSVSVTAGTGLSIWTPQSGKKFRLIGWDLAPVTASSQAGIQFQDTVTYNTANEFLRVPRFLSVNWTPTPRSIGPNGYLSTAANNQLWIDVTVTTNVEGYVYGFEE